MSWRYVPMCAEPRLKKDRRANSVRVLGTFSSGASDDCRGRTGTAIWIRSFKFAGVEEDIVLNVVVLYVCGRVQLIESEQSVRDLHVQLSTARSSSREIAGQLSEKSSQLVLLNAELERVSLQNSSMAEEVRTSFTSFSTLPSFLHLC